MAGNRKQKMDDNICVELTGWKDLLLPLLRWICSLAIAPEYANCLILHAKLTEVHRHVLIPGM
jgi:hypothetical protein